MRDAIALPGTLEPMRAPERDGLAGATGSVARGSPYIAQLDSLRAFAVGGVLIHHHASAYFDQSLGGLAQAGVHASTGTAGRLLGLRCLQYAGRISYGIYVYHPFIPVVLAALAAWVGFAHWLTGWNGFAASTALTLLIAALSWHLFEKPINALKRHFDEPLPVRIEPSARR